MTDQFVSLHKWYVELQRTCAGHEVVDEIVSRMGAESDEEALRSLAFILASEFQRQERYPEAEVILLDLSEQDPSSHIHLSSWRGRSSIMSRSRALLSKSWTKL
jgi:hypothetical protein